MPSLDRMKDRVRGSAAAGTLAVNCTKGHDAEATSSRWVRTESQATQRDTAAMIMAPMARAALGPVAVEQGRQAILGHETPLWKRRPADGRREQASSGGRRGELYNTCRPCAMAALSCCSPVWASRLRSSQT
jgi:hypothetical protein